MACEVESRGTLGLGRHAADMQVPSLLAVEPHLHWHY